MYFFTHSWACFAEYVITISSDVIDGCPSPGCASPFRGLSAFIWNGLFNHNHWDTTQKSASGITIAVQHMKELFQRKAEVFYEAWISTATYCVPLARTSSPPHQSLLDMPSSLWCSVSHSVYHQISCSLCSTSRI